MTSYVVKQTQCSQCKALGKDTSHDNLANYSDGHSYCYSCGYTITTSGNDKINQFTQPKQVLQKHAVLLPEDCTNTYPERALNWIKQYELSENTLNLHNCVWSESISRLIFPIYSVNNTLLAYQGRNFSLDTTKKIPKWYGEGNLKDIFNILGRSQGAFGLELAMGFDSPNILVLTEDIVSAIKVSICGVMAMPLYGCVVGRERFKRLYKLYGDTVGIYIWLDPDKRTEALKEAKLGQLCGLHTHPIFSDKDPKEHTFLEIKEILQ
jgi:hypothetical protein